MRLLLAATALVCLTACSSGDTDEPAEPTKEALPTVSAATTCGALFDGDAPAEGVVDLMAAEASAADRPKAEAFAEDLAAISAQANDELKPHVDLVADELREYAATEVGDMFETDEMVTSLTELNNVCGNTPRF